MDEDLESLADVGNGGPAAANEGPRLRKRSMSVGAMPTPAPRAPKAPRVRRIRCKAVRGVPNLACVCSCSEALAACARTRER